MSRHAARVADRALWHPYPSPFAATAPLPLALLPGALSRRSAVCPSRPRVAVRELAAAGSIFQYVTTTARASGPVTAAVGSRRAFHTHIRPLRSPVHSAARDRWRLHKRLKSGDDAIQKGVPAKQAQTLQQAREDSSQVRNSPHLSTGAGGKALLNRLPHIHRPTKEELLAAATGFWHRLQIRFKWFSIRSVRPFNVDDIGAFLSWIFWGHVLWIVIGTTTFVSLAIWAVNTVFAQETVAGWVGNYLTKSSGIKVVFENAIVPTWRDGVITFNNVFVSRRPGQASKRERTVSKGSSTTAAAAAAEAALAERVRNGVANPEDDGNYTQFDVTIDTVNVTLSFAKWFNGKGLLRDVEVRGVRGVLDRTAVHPTGEVRDPKSYRHTHHTGDFEIDNFKMEDVLLTVYQPKNFRPFTVSVFSCELPRLRKQWLFYDFMSANNMSGSFDDSLFTIHPRQVHGMTGAALTDGRVEGEEGQHWKKHSRLRIDGLKIDHLNRGVQGPFSWIHEGNVDIVADVMIPDDVDESITKVMSDFYERVEATVTHQAQQTLRSSGTTIQNQDTDNHGDDLFTRRDTTAPTRTTPQPSTRTSDNAAPLVLDIRVHLNDVRASVPLFTKDLSYVNNALTRPIVAYINSRRAFIPITCRVVKRQSEFDGSWTIFDSGLLDDLSREAYEAFVRDIMDARQRTRRIKKVGLWTIQLAAQALFLGLAGQLA